MNIVEWRFGNFLVTCGFVSIAVGSVALFMTGNHLFFIPVGLGIAIVFLRSLVMT